MRKLLILGGTPQHIKLIEAAKAMGVYTIVTDYIAQSKAKEIADKSYCVDIKDINGLIDICKKEEVNGIISSHIDPCQRIYNYLCSQLHFHCYGTKEQFLLMTDKTEFKKMCIENNVDIILEYSFEDIKSKTVNYPVFIKPVDSRGSRGQSVCYSEQELTIAIQKAQEESSNGKVIIEKYMKNAQEFQVTYFFVNGKPYLVRTCDSYCGPESKHMEKVVACAVSPSIYTDAYLASTHHKVVNMFKNLGIKYGPVFMQGFYDDGVFRFFDPGLRFPGVDYERIYFAENNINLMSLMVQIALTGTCDDCIPENGYLLNGKRAAVFFPTVSAGLIKKIQGESKVLRTTGVVSLLPRCKSGDSLDWSYNVNQRLAEIDLIAEDTLKLKELIRKIQHIYRPLDNYNQDMTYTYFDEERIK